MKMMIEGVNLPERKTEGSCGYDIYCPREVTIWPDEWTMMDLGIKMDPGDIPPGYCALIMPRSSMGMRYGLKLSNTVGVIDSDYTMDTIKVSLKIDSEIFKWAIFNKNDRILQMILVPYGIIASERTPTEKREGGVGSTGV